MQRHVAFAREHLGFDNALCGVGGVAGCQEKDMLTVSFFFSFYLKYLFFALGPCSYDPDP